MPWDLRQPSMIDEEGNVSGGMWGTSPMGRAQQLQRTEGTLPGIASLAGNMLMGRGGVGDPNISGLLRAVQGIARKLSRNKTQQEDLTQTGFEGILHSGDKTTRKPTVTAKRDMLNYLEKENPSGIRTSDARRMGKVTSDVEQELGRSVGVADERLMYRRYRDFLRPEQRDQFTIDQFRAIRNAPPNKQVSLETPLTERMTMGDTLRGGEDPSQLAELAQKFRTLTPQQQANIQKVIEGQDINPAIKARILKKFLTGRRE